MLHQKTHCARELGFQTWEEEIEKLNWALLSIVTLCLPFHIHFLSFNERAPSPHQHSFLFVVVFLDLNQRSLWITAEWMRCSIIICVRGWAEPEPKLCARIESLFFVWRQQIILAFQLPLSGRKPKEHPITLTFTLNFLNRYTGRIYSSCFLPDSCNRNASISGSLHTKTRLSNLVSIPFGLTPS